MDRLQRLHMVAMHLPNALYQGSILDGELVFNKATERWNFLVFDAVVVSGVRVSTALFSQRLAAAVEGLSLYTPDNNDCFDVKMKTFFPLRNWREFRERLDMVVSSLYETDGLIFTPEMSPYISGRHMSQFKWKPQKDNTIDFKVMAGAKNWGILDRGIVIAAPVFKADQAALTPGTIIECEYDLETRHWRPRHVRPDKDAPNDRLTLERTMVNIKENIQMEEFDSLFSNQA
jgi:hypothetical protein